MPWLNYTIPLKTLGVVPFFVIISSSGKEKWLPFDDQSGAHEHHHKQPLANSKMTLTLSLSAQSIMHENRIRQRYHLLRKGLKGLLLVFQCIVSVHEVSSQSSTRSDS
jgi:hypothetical protein